MEKIRQPQQERSIEKKNKIIEAAYEIFSEVGYYAANTPEIAKKAGVSTGIIYGYFKNKRDILSYVLKIYINNVALPVMDYFENLNSDSDLKKAVSDVVDMTIDIHSSNANIHNILHSLAVTEKDINEDFINLEDNITSKASEKLSELGVKTDNIKEKVHISMNLIQSFAHENTYDKHKYLNYNAMKNEVENIIIS
ncbi:MAG: helix-turn-helix transcriptional regulator, partial [Clostridia bacterium]|nr:helix-turn-helix transcriptional regulator [Clostridia bacterium]